MYEVIEFACEYDFVNTSNVNPGTAAVNSNTVAVPAPTDLWITLTHYPLWAICGLGI